MRTPPAGAVVVVLLDEVDVVDAEVVDVVDAGASAEVVVGASVVDGGGELEWLLLQAARTAVQTRTTKPKRGKQRIGES
jgi:hypothetical protein